MTTRFEVYIKPRLLDSFAEGLIRDIEDLNIKGAKSARTIKVFEISGDITPDEASRIGNCLLSDPVSQQFVIGKTSGELVKNAWIIEIRFNHGVTDPVADSALKGIRDLAISSATAVRTATKVVLRGKLSADDVETISRKLLANAVIQSFSIEKSA